MQVVPAEEESEAEVRREDQDNINRFARLNARLHELRAERDLIQVSRAFIYALTMGAVVTIGLKDGAKKTRQTLS